MTDQLRHLFQQLIESDRKQFGEKDEAFAENPTQRLNHTLRYLHTDPSEFEALYGEFVNDLVWGQAVDFNEAREAFRGPACQLLKVTVGDEAGSSAISHHPPVGGTRSDRGHGSEKTQLAF